MNKIRITPLSTNGEQPVDFYSWGDAINIGIVSKKEQFNEKLGEAFDSIEIKEDKGTPETDYVLKVLGKEAGRIVIPFDMVVKDAYYDSETKEVVIVVRIGESEEKEIRFSVADLIDVYTGDELTIHVEKNVISITETVMNKFGELGDAITEETERAQKEEAAIREEFADKTKNMVEWQYSTEDRKHIVLGNHENILGTSTNGGTYNLAMVSKWDVADFGSNQLHANLNSKDGKVTINDDKIVATLDDIQTITQEQIYDLFEEKP